MLPLCDTCDMCMYVYLGVNKGMRGSYGGGKAIMYVRRKIRGRTRKR